MKNSNSNSIRQLVQDLEETSASTTRYLKLLVSKNFDIGSAK